MEKPARRSLRLDDFDAVLRDVETLRSAGYDRAGNWDLAQCCGHLAEWMRFPVEGFPPPPAPIRLVLWVMKKTIAPSRLRQALESNSMAAGVPTLRETVPPPAGDEAAAEETLRKAVARFEAHAGPYRPSPMFGAVDRDTAKRLQLVHCAHHLSFLIPKSG